MSVRWLELDYVARPSRAVSPGLALLALSLALAGYLGARYAEARRELVRLDTEMSLVAFERPTTTFPRERLEGETKAAEAVVRRLAAPWAALIGALEQASTRDVALLQLQPDADRRQLQLTAEARDTEAMFAYLENLEASHGLSEVHLVSHEVRTDGPQRPIRFSLQADFR